MPLSQRYISKELTHFVGRKLSTEEARYGVLVEILKSGWLMHPPHQFWQTGLTVNPAASLNDMYNRKRSGGRAIRSRTHLEVVR
jgi:hypothetical protein